MKNKECCKCGYRANYEIDGKYYCEDCAWEFAKELNEDTEEIETTSYYVGGEFVCDDDLGEAIETAFDYEGMECKKLDE